jgi:anti-sigma factor ChrR (cupin superfamily)
MVAAAELDAARAAGFAEGLAEGVKLGTEAERGRITTILHHAEAEGRERLAQHCAVNTDLSVDAAIAVLMAAPRESTKVQPSATSLPAEDVTRGLVIELPRRQGEAG